MSDGRAYAVWAPLAPTLGGMAILVWWVLPAVTTLLAICWAGWVRRTPRPLRDVDTIEKYTRFRAALAAPAPDSPAHAGNSAPTPSV